MKKQKPGPGQESVWDYPRPPAIEEVSSRVKIICKVSTIYDDNNAFRILETSHPPTFYLPLAKFQNCNIFQTDRASFCEWKGRAVYYDIAVGDQQISFPAWGYLSPNPKFEKIRGCISIYAHMMDACFVDGEQVQAQEGDFYGGWITSKVVGPFKGGAGTWGW